MLTDECPSNNVPAFAVKAAYITAISRFVTGLLDSQQDTKYKVSMYAKAQEIGLPALFVDLRHEATHGDMPSLDSLRSATKRALKWLWDDYWRGIGDLGEVTANGEGEDLADKGVIEKIPDQRHQAGDSAVDIVDKYPSNPDTQESWTKWQGIWSVT
ncbi:rRNA-processing protein las1 [Lecanora helva]